MDKRYKQIETETEAEKGLQQSKFAFSGFGRSTDTMSAVDKVLAEAQKRKKQLALVVSFETSLKEAAERNADATVLDSLKSDITKALVELTRLANEARSRRAKAGEELSGVGHKAETSRQSKGFFKNLFKGPKASFKMRAKKFTAKKPESIKTIKPLTAKKGIARVKSLAETSKNFGRHKTLAGNNA